VQTFGFRQAKRPLRSGACQGELLLLVTSFVAGRQFPPAFSPAGFEYLATTDIGHTGSETMFVATLAVAGLESTLHN
jgi:hypothetical protein